MNYWCNTCNCYKGARGADECAVDNHSIVSAKDRELNLPTAHSARLEIIQKLGYGPSSIAGADWIVAKVEAEREAFKAQIAALRTTIHDVHGTLDAVIHASDPLNSMKTWLPIAVRDCRKALGLPVSPVPPLSKEEVELLRKAGFAFKGPEAYKEEWIPQIGDRVWVSGKTWSSAGTITGFAKDDPEVPWIKVDKDGTSWDARDCGSFRRLEDK